mmetsp:Transcript_39145/g.100011  ORF Transcript_39145/g.100011 Transcript_39145/m.100011 type:complete len:201 (+) Transcript_39145:323-925(+)
MELKQRFGWLLCLTMNHAYPWRNLLHNLVYRPRPGSHSSGYDSRDFRSVFKSQHQAVADANVVQETIHRGRTGRRVEINAVVFEIHGKTTIDSICAKNPGCGPLLHRVCRRSDEELLPRAVTLTPLDALPFDTLRASCGLKITRQNASPFCRELSERVQKGPVTIYDDGRLLHALWNQQKSQQQAFGFAPQQRQVRLKVG